MRTLDAGELLDVWEGGHAENGVQRVLRLLRHALPAFTQREILDLPLGQRDMYLLELRSRMFGATFGGYRDCDACSARLELTISAAEILDNMPDSAVSVVDVYAGDQVLQVRLPTSEDLLALLSEQDPERARYSLAQRCVLNADVELTAEILSWIGARLAEADPRSDILFNLVCGECGSESVVSFDIASYLWDEIEWAAKRVLRDVDTLARAYGWCEHDVLAISGFRRQHYISMVGNG